MTTRSEKPDDIIAELHEVRETLVAEHDGDLRALTEAARERAMKSGRRIIEKSDGTNAERPKRRRS